MVSAAKGDEPIAQQFEDGGVGEFFGACSTKVQMVPC
jgi:hypothetical protein